MNHVFGLKMYVMYTVSMDEPRVWPQNVCHVHGVYG